MKLNLDRTPCPPNNHTGYKLFHYNGLGWSWWWCQRCGKRFDIVGPHGEQIPDDEANDAPDKHHKSYRLSTPSL